MHGQELIQARINTKGIRGEDIRHKDRLTDDQIADIPVERVYAWIRCGSWREKDFKKWLKVMRVIE
jgi:hypothetical protein